MIIPSVVALVIAGIFAVFVPNRDKVMAAAGWRYLVLRWFHSLVWVLLALAFFMAATGDAALQPFVSPVGMLGGITYLIYIVTIMRAK